MLPLTAVLSGCGWTSGTTVQADSSGAMMAAVRPNWRSPCSPTAMAMTRWRWNGTRTSRAPWWRACPTTAGHSPRRKSAKWRTRCGTTERRKYMDVHCSTCNEPWDVYHLWQDAIFETGLSVEEAEAWCSLPRSQKLSDRYRKEFRAAGWEFGYTVINV